MTSFPKSLIILAVLFSLLLGGAVLYAGTREHSGQTSLDVDQIQQLRRTPCPPSSR